jgi:hypothetical protein
MCCCRQQQGGVFFSIVLVDEQTNVKLYFIHISSSPQDLHVMILKSEDQLKSER